MSSWFEPVLSEDTMSCTAQCLWWNSSLTLYHGTTVLLTGCPLTLTALDSLLTKIEKPCMNYVSSCADPEWGISEKSQKYRFSGNTGPDPLKLQSYQVSIQCWAIIGTPAKRHLNGFSLAGRWWSAYSGIWILPPLINQKTSKLNLIWQNFQDPRME